MTIIYRRSLIYILSRMLGGGKFLSFVSVLGVSVVQFVYYQLQLKTIYTQEGTILYENVKKGNEEFSMCEKRT